MWNSGQLNAKSSTGRSQQKPLTGRVADVCTAMETASKNVQRLQKTKLARSAVKAVSHSSEKTAEAQTTNWVQKRFISMLWRFAQIR